MRIAGILLRRDDRRSVRDEAFVLEPAGHCLLHVELGQRPLVAASGPDEIESTILHAIERFRCAAVRVQRLFSPDRLEALDEIA